MDIDDQRDYEEESYWRDFTPEDDDEMCECELDWRCGMHSHLATPEDIIATHWSQDQG